MTSPYPCVECDKEGKEHVVHVGGSTTTAMYFEPYYDGLGYHHHDGNSRNTSYSCSNGHSWSAREPNRCPNLKCDWRD